MGLVGGFHHEGLGGLFYRFLTDHGDYFSLPRTLLPSYLFWPQYVPVMSGVSVQIARSDCQDGSWRVQKAGRQRAGVEEKNEFSRTIYQENICVKCSVCHKLYACIQA